MKELWRKFFYSLLERIFKNRESEMPIKLKGNEKVLIFRYDKIGDMVVSLPSLEFLRIKFPQVQIWVLASTRNKFLLQHYPFVNSTIVLPNNIFKFIWFILHLRRQQFDLIINYVFHKTTKAGLLANLIGPSAIKVNLGHETRNDVYRKLFNCLVNSEVRWKVPMSEFLVHYLCQIFGLPFDKGFTESYNFFIPKESLTFASDFIEKVKGKIYLLINISAGRLKWRSENYKKLAERIRNLYPYVGIIFVCHPSDKKELAKIIKGLNGSVYSYSSSNFYNVIALLKFVDIVFTPDTSIVHFANAFRKVIVFVHPSNNASTYEWQPNLSPHVRLSSSSKKDYNEIGVDEIFESIKFFLDQMEDQKLKLGLN